LERVGVRRLQIILLFNLLSFLEQKNQEERNVLIPPHALLLAMAPALLYLPTCLLAYFHGHSAGEGLK